MKLEKRKILETSLFDDEQIVTVQYLSRHANIPVDDASQTIKSFYEENKEKTKLYAVYVLSGKLLPQISSDKIKIRRYCTQYVRDVDLEKARSAFTAVYTCEIYCLNSKPVQNIATVYSVDSLYDNEFVRTDPEHSWLSCSEAGKKRLEMLKLHEEQALKILKTATDKHEVQSKANVSKEQIKNKTNIAEMFTKSGAKPIAQALAVNQEVQTTSNVSKESAKKKDGIAVLFNKAGTKAASQAKSGVKRTSKTASKSTKGLGVKSTERKRRGKPLMIDDDDDETEATVLAHEKEVKKEIYSPSEHPQIDRDAKVNMSPDEKLLDNKSGSTAYTSLLTQDDLFSDGDSSSDRTNLSAMVGYLREKTPPQKKTRRSSSADELNNEKSKEELETSQSNQIKKKPVRKQYVTETFVDDEGYLVTKDVLKDVEVEETCEPLLSQKITMGGEKKSVKKSLINKGDKSTCSKQAKISSFFKKA